MVKSASVWCLVFAGANIKLQFLIGGSLETAKLLMAAGTAGFIGVDLIDTLRQLRRPPSTVHPHP
jgi:hypothetical protein